MTARIASTFSALAKLADFSASSEPAKEEQTSEEQESGGSQEKSKQQGKGFRTEFHYNIQIHLPANGTEEVYLNIFNALRRVFQ